MNSLEGLEKLRQQGLSTSGTRTNQGLATTTRRGGLSLEALRITTPSLTNKKPETLATRIEKGAKSPQLLAQASAILKENSTELVFIFDRSGSCQGTEQATMSGFNDLIQRERQTGYKTTVSTILFNHYDELVHDRIDINQIRGLGRYVADGATALYYTLDKNLRRIKRIHDLDKTNAPKNTIVVIMTDGEDNRSQAWLESAQRTIAECKARGWKFIFLGAYINAKETAQLLGIEAKYAEDYHASDRGVLTNFQAVKNVLKSLRETGQIAPNWANPIQTHNHLALGAGNNHQQPNGHVLRLGGK